MKPLASRMGKVSPSLTVAIDSKAKELKASGLDIVGLGAGEPDFDTPEHIKQAAIDSILKGLTKYTAPAGIPAVKEAICRKFKRENGLDYTPDQIVISSGAKHSVYNVLTALVEEGDEVIIPAPYWVTYPELVKMLGGTPVVVSAGVETEFKISPEQLEAAITPKTKLVILNSPSNPTGSIYSAEELKAFADVIVKHDLYCMSDEIYEHMVYDGAKHVSIASFGQEIYNRTVVINGVSKAFSMTGWRVGYLGAPLALAKAIATVQSQATHHPANASQYASLAALEGGLECVETMRVEFEARRNFVIDGLRAIPNVKIPTPKGAFYAFPDVSAYLGKKDPAGKTISNSVELCAYLLEEELLAVVPGAGFGCEGCIRLSYAAKREVLDEALKRLARGLAKLS